MPYISLPPHLAFEMWGGAYYFLALKIARPFLACSGLITWPHYELAAS